jgi:hypothetical protein
LPRGSSFGETLLVRGKFAFYNPFNTALEAVASSCAISPASGR